MKKTLVVIFCIGNTNEDLNADRNIINANDYLDKKNLAQNKDLTDQEDSNVKLLNFDSVEFLKVLFAGAYESDELV